MGSQGKVEINTGNKYEWNTWSTLVIDIVRDLPLES